MPRIKAVIFDMDGVLINAKEWHYEALNKALSMFGMEISRYDHLVTYDGLPTKKKLEMLSLERGLPNSLHDFINEIKQKYTLEIAFAKCNPIFHHEYCLIKLREAGYRLAVCSNSVRSTMDLMLEKASLAQYLEFYLSNQDVTYPKPHPEIYENAIKYLKLSPSECLIVEDNINGIKAAQQSGAHLLAVQDIAEVNFDNIIQYIDRIEQKNA